MSCFPMNVSIVSLNMMMQVAEGAVVLQPGARENVGYLTITEQRQFEAQQQSVGTENGVPESTCKNFLRLVHDIMISSFCLKWEECMTVFRYMVSVALAYVWIPETKVRVSSFIFALHPKKEKRRKSPPLMAATVLSP
ncbi:hypothetical protein EJ110_NYTH18631 [Nymphaea thermarum]|nr:hypothetical protein EJ110_NYTH18631 [Nymphaea thermarum]